MMEVRVSAPVRPLITVDELHHLMSSPRTTPTLLDVRWELGRPNGQSEYEQEHLPGAVYIDLDNQLSSPPGPDGKGGRHPMPDKKLFASVMQHAGVRDDRPVVCYDVHDSLPASRAWWMLRYYGKHDVQVLDGGLAAWLAAGYPTESGSFTPKSGHFTPHKHGRHKIKAGDVQQYADRGRLLDARPSDRFRGENETIDKVAGHIPGARNVPAVENLEDDGRFLPPRQLRERLTKRLGSKNAKTNGDELAIYCGSGVQAAHLALALEVAGMAKDPAVYVGSWSDWITKRDRPIETWDD
jgi:thiosulfate/3-mercaptopyruvate sulfurtransferase